MNLIQKLAKIRKIVDVVTKSKQGHNYTYADITEILAKVKTGMEKFGISLIPEITPGSSSVSQLTIVNTKLDKAGTPYDRTTTEMLYNADMSFRWVNDEDPEDYLYIPWHIVGQQSDPSQAFGSGLTYCTRYFLTEYFQIPQVSASDVDEFRSKQKEAEAAEETEIAVKIIKNLDTEINMYLSDHPDDRDKIVVLVKKYVRNGDYFKIKDPRLAGKLMSEFMSTFKPEAAEQGTEQEGGE